MSAMWVELVGREPWRFRSEHGEFEAFPDELGDGPPPPIAAFFEERGYLDVRRRRVVVGIGDPTVEHFADVEIGGRIWTYRLYPAAAATPVEWIAAGYEAPGRFAVGLLLDLAESSTEGWYVETKRLGDDEWFSQRITDPADLEEIVRTFAVQGDDMLRVTRILDPVAPSPGNTAPPNTDLTGDNMPDKRTASAEPQVQNIAQRVEQRPSNILSRATTGTGN